MVSASLDILAELAARYGGQLPDPEGLKKALLPELDESRAGVRKRAIQCLASLAAALPPPSLDDLCSQGGWVGGWGRVGGWRRWRPISRQDPRRS